MKLLFIKNSFGEKLSGILRENKKTKEIIILCHGSGSSKESNLQKHLGSNLDYNTFRFDFSGSGNSQGKIHENNYSKEIKDLLSVIDYFLEKKYIIKSVIGYSKGGSNILLASKFLEEKTKSIIAISPRINLFNSTEMKEYLKNKKVAREYIKDIKKWSNIIKHYNKKIQTLVIHGTKDQTINISESKEFVKKFKSVKLIKIKDGQHNLDNKLEELSLIIKKYLVY